MFTRPGTGDQHGDQRIPHGWNTETPRCRIQQPPAEIGIHREGHHTWRPEPEPCGTLEGCGVFPNDFVEGGNDGKRMGKGWENDGKMMGKWWENDGKRMGKWWEEDGEMMGKWWENDLKKTINLSLSLSKNGRFYPPICGHFHGESGDKSDRIIGVWSLELLILRHVHICVYVPDDHPEVDRIQSTDDNSMRFPCHTWLILSSVSLYVQYTYNIYIFFHSRSQ